MQKLKEKEVKVKIKVKEKTVKVKGKWIEHYCLIANEIEKKEELDFLVLDIADV